jgi:blue light- and temperature-responsive anti-repressor
MRKFITEGIEHTFAFQPIASAETGEAVSFEALVRGPAWEPAGVVLSKVQPELQQRFDNGLRAAAILLSHELGNRVQLNLNMLPSSFESVEAVLQTLSMAESCGIDPSRLVIEITEGEVINDIARFASSVHRFRGSGLQFSIDDFGAGHSGLNLLADFQPDSIKLDMSLVRAIDRSGPRQAIIRGIWRTCTDLGIDIIAEGVETEAEYWWLRSEGIEFFQGYLLARPGGFWLPAAVFPGDPRRLPPVPGAGSLALAESDVHAPVRSLSASAPAIGS